MPGVTKAACVGVSQADAHLTLPVCPCVVLLQADIVADDVIFNHLRRCPAVETASSEEQSDILPMGGQGYTVSMQAACDGLNSCQHFPAAGTVPAVLSCKQLTA
jgi:fructose-1,6-bisphosphatase